MGCRIAMLLTAVWILLLATGCDDCTSPDTITLHHRYDDTVGGAGTISFWYVILGDSLSESSRYSLTAHLDSDPAQGINGDDPAEITVDFSITRNALSIDGPDDSDTTPFIKAYGFNEPDPEHITIAVSRLNVPSGTHSMIVELEHPANSEATWNRIAVVEGIEVVAGEITSAGVIYAFPGDRIAKTLHH